jgi:hypothetical protein
MEAGKAVFYPEAHSMTIRIGAFEEVKISNLGHGGHKWRRALSVALSTTVSAICRSGFSLFRCSVCAPCG